MSHLAECLREQQALLVLLLSRSAAPEPGDRPFSSTHLRRAVYAHLAVLTDVVAARVEPLFPYEAIVSATKSVTECLALLLLTKDSSPEKYLALTSPLTTLFSVERALIAAAMLGLSGEDLRQVGFAVEEQFETLYGRGELAAERGASQMGAL